MDLLDINVESKPHGFLKAFVVTDSATGLSSVRFLKNKTPQNVHACALSWANEHKEILDTDA